MSNLIATDLQGQTIDSPLVDLFELTLPDGTEIFFHPGVDNNLNTLQFRSLDNSTINTYIALPVVMDGIDIQAGGAMNRPTLTMANVTSILSNALGPYKYDDLVGQTIVRRQTLQKYLVGESPDLSNPAIELNKSKFKIDRVGSETSIMVSFELAVAYDLEGIQIPRRVVVGKYCSWMYQGHYIYGKGGCTWSPSGEHKDYDAASSTAKAHNLYFNIEDKPLVLGTWLTANATTWSNASVSYTQNSYVIYNTKYWLCQIVHTSDAAKDPDSTSSYWKEVKSYSPHNTAGPNYAIGDLVRYTATINAIAVDTIWRCVAVHDPSDADTVPATKTKYWSREDMCGKTLNSCKCRFQANVTDITTPGSPPSSKKDTSSTLPFGAFPGTAKF